MTGALGGMGGQSAFGTKAGDMFTRVTMVTAGIWIFLCMLSIWMLGSQDEWATSGSGRSGNAPAGAVALPEGDSPASSALPATGGEGGADASAGTAEPAAGGADAASPSAPQEAASEAAPAQDAATPAP